MFGRVFAGFMMDRFWAPGVVFPMLILPAIACLLLMNHDMGEAQRSSRRYLLVLRRALKPISWPT